MRTFRLSRAAWLAALSLAAGCSGSRPRAAALSHDTLRPSATQIAADRDPQLDLFAASTASLDIEHSGTKPEILTASHDQISNAGSQSAPDAPDAPSEMVDVNALSLATLEAWALESNPSIRQASASAYKAMGFRNQVGLAPNPTIGFFGEQIGDAGTDQYGAFVSQDIITGGKLQLNQNVLSHSVQSQLWEVETQRYRVLTDVRLRFYEALAAQQRLNAATEFDTVLAEGVRIAEVRKEAAEGSVPEILLAKIQRNEVRLVQQRAKYSFEAAWNELAATVGNRSLQPTSLAVPNAPSLAARNWEAVYSDVTSRSPELKAANARVCRAAANVQRQNAQPIPNIELQAGLGHDLATDQQFGRVQAGLPIPLFNKNQGNIAAADAEYCRAQQEYQRLRMSLSARLARTANEFDSALATVDQYVAEILPQAQQSLDLSEKAYSAGEFSYLQVLTARRTYFDATMVVIDAKRDLAKASAAIDGLLLSGGLDATSDTPEDDGLRGQSLSGQ